jgi:hypothetical protein
MLASGGARIPLITTLFGLEGEAAQAVDDAYLAARYAWLRAEAEERARQRPRFSLPARSAIDEISSDPDGYGWHEGTRRVSCCGIEMSLVLLMRLERELGPQG